MRVAAVGSVEEVAGSLVERVRGDLAARAEPITTLTVAAAVRRAGLLLGEEAVWAITAQLRNELDGLGPLAGLLGEPAVTDVLVNGPDEVWVDRGHGLERVPVAFPDAGAVRAFAVRLAARAGRRLDDAMPWVDARLAGGLRLHAVLPPLAPDGPLVSLRVPARRAFGLDDLVAAGSVPTTLVQVLRDVVASRCAFLVSGGTGTGKTTVLASLLGLVPAQERIVLVEDSGELQPQHPHVVRLEARTANVDGAGGVGLDVLVRQALRMRPDRLVVGEVRGREVVDLLAALNTGHDGGCGTLHANTAAAVPARLEALGVAAGLDRPAVHSLTAAGVDVVLHLTRGRDGRRRLAQVAALESSPDGLAVVVPAWSVTPDGSTVSGPAADLLAERVNPDRRRG